MREGSPAEVRTAKVVAGQLSLLRECLDELDRAVLVFAVEHHLHGRVRGRVQEELGMTETRYYQLLVALLGRPAGADAEPEPGHPATGTAGAAPTTALTDEPTRWQSRGG